MAWVADGGSDPSYSHTQWVNVISDQCSAHIRRAQVKYPHLTLVSDIQMGAVCCFSSRSVTLVYQLSPCSWRVPETIAMSVLKGTLCRATTCQDVTPQFLQFLALLQQLLARHVSLPEIETFVMTQERIVVQVLKRRWHHHLARGLRAVWVFKAVLQPICNRRPRSNSGWG